MTSDKILALVASAQKALKNQDYRRAHQQLLNILNIEPTFSDAFFLLAMIPLENGNIDKAIELLTRANNLSPNNGEYCVYLTKCYALKGDVVNTAKWAEESITKELKSAFNYDVLGVAYSRIGLYEESVKQFQKAIDLKGDEANFYYNLASALKFLGDFKGAKIAYENTINYNNKHYKAHAALTSLGGITISNNHIDCLSALLKGSQSTKEQLYLSHALASEYEMLGDFDQAFKILDKAKSNRGTEIGYRLEEDKEMFASIRSIFSSENFKLPSGYSNKEAIFVVGMPRTGTTLVERIISNHPDVKSVGELHNFELLLKKIAKIEQHKLITIAQMKAASAIDYSLLGSAYIESVKPLTGGNHKFVDKLPLNILLAGFIAKALPNCKIICLDRDPLDTIISNYRQMFSPNYAYCNYSTSLESTSHFYLEFKKLMSFWQKKIPNNFTVVNYEKLVNNPEVEARKMMEFCELSWDPAYVEIHNNSAPVATASAMQVRQPISNQSVGNWKKYDKYLAKVKEILLQNSKSFN